MADITGGDPATLAAKVVRALLRGQRTLVYPGPLGVIRHEPTLAAWATSFVTRDRARDRSGGRAPEVASR